VLPSSYILLLKGSGSAGCALANRLSENKKWKILLLEAGRQETFITDVPLTASGESFHCVHRESIKFASLTLSLKFSMKKYTFNPLCYFNFGK
jgi:choline dehydrogenase-like flavoprotein